MRTSPVPSTNAPRSSCAGPYFGELRYSLGPQSNSMAVGDFDGDGIPDVVVAGGAKTTTLSFRRGDGTGRLEHEVAFDLPIEYGPITSADLNRDGLSDLIVLQSRGSVSVLWNRGHGVFVPAGQFEVGHSPSSIAVADVDADGDPDLVVTNYDTGTISVLNNLGNGQFAAHADYFCGLHPLAIACGDFDGDGRVDLAVVNYGPHGSVTILANQGFGDFAVLEVLTVGAWPFGVAASDFDGDGNVDLAVSRIDVSATAPAVFALYLNHGSSAFVLTDATITPWESSYVLTLADVDGNGDMDLLGSGSGTLALVHNLGGGALSKVQVMDVAYDVAGVVPADVDRNGTTDLVILDGKRLDVALNPGDGKFNTRIQLTSAPQHAIGHADIDSNGTDELLVTAANRVEVYREEVNRQFVQVSAADVGTDPAEMTTADFDGNGTIDVAMANYTSKNVSVLLNQGSGNFAPQVTYTIGGKVLRIAHADLDGNGWEDLVVTIEQNSPGKSLSILWNQGHANFSAPTKLTVGAGPDGLACADFDGDGRPDIAVTNSIDNTVSVLINQANGVFANQVPYLAGLQPHSLVAGDFDGDGDVDLAVLDWGEHRVTVLWNAGNGTFHVLSKFAVGFSDGTLISADVDGNGLPDLIAIDNSAEAAVLLNRSNHMLALDSRYFIVNPIATTTDFDGDGQPDIASVGIFAGTVAVSFGRCH